MARISIASDEVRWDDFYLPGDRRRRAEHLSFVFDRADYEAAIEAVATSTPVTEQLWPAGS